MSSLFLQKKVKIRCSCESSGRERGCSIRSSLFYVTECTFSYKNITTTSKAAGLAQQHSANEEAAIGKKMSSIVSLVIRQNEYQAS